MIKHQDLTWLKDDNDDFILFNFEQINQSYFQGSIGKQNAGVYFLAHLMTQFVIEVKFIDYDTFMSIDIKQNDILHEMFTWSETYIKL